MELVVVAAARELIPYLADAVPGWFQAALALYDAKGHELEHADHYLFHPDPVLHYEIPKDGEYVVEIRDSIYRGREDFVYRITLGELPYVTSIFPLGGPAGAQTTVELKGWNLPVTTLTLTNTEPGIYPLSVRKEDRLSNHVPFAVDTLPECLEQEPNNSMAAAQPVTLPIIVNGRIDQPGDWDVFRFEGRAGDTIVAEVYARRLDSPLDSVLKLTDASGKQLAFNDDHEDKGAGLDTHYADSYLTATLPADGAFYIHLGDAQHQGGPEYGLPLAHQPAATRFRVARRAVQPQRPRRRFRPPHRVCPPAGRVHQRDHAVFAGRAGGIQVERGQGAGKPGPGPAHSAGPARPHGETPRPRPWKAARLSRDTRSSTPPCPPKT